MGAERGADVIVVGAGIIGAACAWRLAREGYRVSVVDDRRAGATAASSARGVSLAGNSERAMRVTTRAPTVGKASARCAGLR